MPTYEYLCRKNHSFEKFESINAEPRTKCPTCGETAERQISGGLRPIFNGSGFYETDYGRKSSSSTDA